MAPERVTLTPEGKERLEHELEELRAKSQGARERVREALEATHGDSADALEYVDAQWDQARIGGRIAELERLLAEAEVVEAPPAGDVAGLGSAVLVRNEEGTERYILVAPAEADPRRGRVSAESPVGRALLGRRPGERVEVETPAGPRHLEIVAVE